MAIDGFSRAKWENCELNGQEQGSKKDLESVLPNMKQLFQDRIPKDSAELEKRGGVLESRLRVTLGSKLVTIVIQDDL